MNHKNKDVLTKGELLAADERAAIAMGLTYGKYRALTYTPSAPQKAPKTPENKKARQEHLKHYKRFKLWKSGLSDEEIATITGVSRIAIVKWRDIMELPAAKKCKYRDKYRLVETEYGIYVVTDE